MRATVILLSCALAAFPMGAQQAPQLSPKAAYEEAMHPLDVTRHSIANWSDVEMDALRVAIQRAQVACMARDIKSFHDAELIDDAKLCALGLVWPAVVQATGLYISAAGTDKPLLNQAYAAKVDAELHLKDEAAALVDALAMLKAVPYDSLVAQVVDEALEYMQFAKTADALTLSAARQPLLLAAMKTAPAGKSAATAEAAAAMPALSLHELYSEGIRFAALEQLASKPVEAQATVAELDAAVPAGLVPDEALPIADSRRMYGLLGHPLPAIPLLESLSMPTKVLPTLPAPRAVTALLLFPDWCSQCVRMGKDFPQSVFRVEGHEAYLYGLLAETRPAPPKPAKPDSQAKPSVREVLAETPTVVVPVSVLTRLAAADFPVLLLADANGVVRVLQPVGEDLLQPGGTLDTAVAVVARAWPLKAEEKAAAKVVGEAK